MSRIPALSRDEAPADARGLLDAMKQKYGVVPHIFGVMAHHPPLLQACADWNDAIGKDLPARYRELAYLKSSLVNGCEYCATHHRKAAAAAGVSEAGISAAASSSPSTDLDDKDRAVLRFAEVLTKQADAPADLVEELKTFLSPPQLVALVGAIGLANFTNRFNHAFAIELP